jgi:DnaJ-class molecular chaperone
MIVTHYDVLQVSRMASREVVQASWKALMQTHHPDKEQGNEQYARRLNEAYAVLSDPKKREAYDRLLGPRPAQTIRIDETAYPSPYPGIQVPRFDVNDLYKEFVDAVDLPKVIEEGLGRAAQAVLGRVIRENPMIEQILNAAQSKAKKTK